MWTRDIGRALRVSKALRFGCVWINDHIPLASEMPHGGFKQSGYGKDLSMYSVEDYTVSSTSWPASADMESRLSTWAAGSGALALRGWCVVGWVGGGPAALCATRGQADMRGFGWPQDRGSSWGAAV